jgi:hypothetical protein
MKKLLIGLALLTGGFSLYNADALYGKYLFSQMCKNESGARFYKRVEKGQGWLEELKISRDGMRHLEMNVHRNRGFMRFQTVDGQWFDARLKAPPPVGTPQEVVESPQYTLVEPANWAVPVRYAQRVVSEQFNPNPKLLERQSFSKYQWQIIDLQSNEVVASFTNFGYAWTSPDRVILNGPTGTTCSEGSEEERNFISNTYTKGEPK